MECVIEVWFRAQSILFDTFVNSRPKGRGCATDDATVYRKHQKQLDDAERRREMADKDRIVGATVPLAYDTAPTLFKTLSAMHGARTHCGGQPSRERRSASSAGLQNGAPESALFCFCYP